MTLSLLVMLLLWSGNSPQLPQIAIDTATQAELAFTERAMEVTAKLVSFPTFHKNGLANKDNLHFQRMSAYLKSLAKAFDFAFEDYGDVIVISLGSGPERLGLITHGDVVPADASKWKKSPFKLDRDSEPGKLVGRGVEDDKGPIALALFAMKALANSGLILNRKIELIISYTEESSWEPFRAFLKKVPPPPINIALDANYPVTIAEKGWSGVWLGFANPKPPSDQGPRITDLKGGSFLSQVPAEASATLSGITPKRLKNLRKAAQKLTNLRFEFRNDGDTLMISAHGLAAHSSTPDQGINAIAHLAHVMAQFHWQPSAEANAIAFIHQRIGLGFKAEKFGELAFNHAFMGGLTLNLGTVEKKDGNLLVGLNFRSPAGKSAEQLETEIRQTVHQWQQNHPDSVSIERLFIGEAHLPENPPHVPQLLQVFTYFTGQKNPKPISIGGATHARLVPNGVNFGPAMPNTAYTGHSEHEYLTERQFRLNLRMYTAMLVLLATEAGNL